MEERIKGRKNFPTDEIDPKNFILDEKVKEMVENLEDVRFNQDDYLGLYNCVHCGECESMGNRRCSWKTTVYSYGIKRI